ncbi:MAG: TetR/AcrR family transcriptional regulator [Candidatus Kurthia intestinigallinarum]
MNMSKKEDPRAIRTKEMLKQAVIELLQQGIPAEKLSIQKVSQQAGLNRTTFYLHYEDIHDLLRKLTDEIVGEITKQIEELMQVRELSEKSQLIRLLDYLYNQRQHLLVLFQKNDFEEKLYEQMKRLISVRRENSVTQTPRRDIDIDIKTASLVGIMMWWLKRGLHYSSDYIATEIYKMYR